MTVMDRTCQKSVLEIKQWNFKIVVFLINNWRVHFLETRGWSAVNIVLLPTEWYCMYGYIKSKNNRRKISLMKMMWETTTVSL